MTNVMKLILETISQFQKVANPIRKDRNSHVLLDSEKQVDDFEIVSIEEKRSFKEVNTVNKIIFRHKMTDTFFELMYYKEENLEGVNVMVQGYTGSWYIFSTQYPDMQQHTPELIAKFNELYKALTGA